MPSALVILTRQSDAAETAPDAIEVWCQGCENKCWFSREARALIGKDAKVAFLCVQCFMAGKLPTPS